MFIKKPFAEHLPHDVFGALDPGNQWRDDVVLVVVVIWGLMVFKFCSWLLNLYHMPHIFTALCLLCYTNRMNPHLTELGSVMHSNKALFPTSRRPCAITIIKLILQRRELSLREVSEFPKVTQIRSGGAVFHCMALCPSAS